MCCRLIIGFPSFFTRIDPEEQALFCRRWRNGLLLRYSRRNQRFSPIGQVAFYGLTNYATVSNTYLASVQINTPITSDRYGNIFFGFLVTGWTPLNLQSGIARIDYNGTGAWISAGATVSNAAVSQVAMNCAPALSNDHRTLYVAVNNGYAGYGYLVALDSRTLAPINSVRLKDVKNPLNDANVDDDSTASPLVGPDGDVYFGVLENPWYSNNDRGWLLHFDSTLTRTRLPGAFGWDDTASIVPASLVRSYHGGSSYLLMTKYNNYADPRPRRRMESTELPSLIRRTARRIPSPAPPL